MQITLNIPDEYIPKLQPTLNHLTQHLLETLIIEAYNIQTLTHADVGQILNLNRFEVDALLKKHNAETHYTIEDLHQDLNTLQKLQQP